MTDATTRRRVKERLSALVEEKRRMDCATDDSPMAGEEDGVDRLSAEEVGRWLLNRARSDAPDLAPDLGLSEDLEKVLDAGDNDIRRELPTDVDRHDLSQTGWGVIFPSEGYHRVSRLLEPFLKLREQQAGQRFRRFTYKSGESGQSFLASRGETLGTIKPSKVPYYLLIVGGPEKIPFEFQYHLSLNHAVGRIDFADREGFANYAEQVCAAESEEIRLSKRAVIFSVEAENDRASAILAKDLTRPLYRCLSETMDDWQVELWRKRKTTKQRLKDLFAGKAPGLFVTATHGCSLGPLNKEQATHQGALSCHLRGSGKAPLFAASDLPEEANLRGQIAMLFACYSAGLPRLDNFPESKPDQTASSARPPVLTTTPFIARLPQEMLRRGTLAVLGHVDRGWSISFQWPGGLSAVSSLEDSIKQLLSGERLGHALRPLYRRYAFLAASLSNLLDKARHGADIDPKRLGINWTAVNDARNFIILGDPAVYLLGQRSETSHVVRLNSEIWAQASQRAIQAGMSVEEWIHSNLGQILGPSRAKL